MTSLTTLTTSICKHSFLMSLIQYEPPGPHLSCSTNPCRTDPARAGESHRLHSKDRLPDRKRRSGFWCSGEAHAAFRKMRYHLYQTGRIGRLGGKSFIFDRGLPKKHKRSKFKRLSHCQWSKQGVPIVFNQARRQGLIAAPLIPLRAIIHPLGYLQ